MSRKFKQKTVPPVDCEENNPLATKSETIYSTKADKPVKSESAFFLKTAFIIIFVCFLCEIFVFNARHFVTNWGDGQIDMSSPECSISNMDFNKQYGLFIPTGEGKPEIVFPNINKRVVTVYIDAVFTDEEFANKQSFQINYGSEEHPNKTTSAFYVIRGVEESKYVTLHTYGKVSHIRLMYGDQYITAAIRGVTLNKPVPLKIFWPRLLLFSIVAFCIVVIKRKNFFSLPLRSNSVGQKILTYGIMLAFTAYLFMLMLFYAPFSLKRPFKENFANEPEPWDQYNAEIVDAILDGHAYLNMWSTEGLKTLKNPYDPEERIAANVYPPWDHVYYNGRFYSYFGIVQVLVLSLPYKLITGRYIPTRVAVFIFSALAGVFLMLIWRRLVFRYMKKMPLGMYALGLLTVAMCSMLSFLVVRPRVYEVAISAALSFTASGFWLILGNSAKKKSRCTEIAVGSLCMALSVGCRTSHMFFLLLIPFVLFDELKEWWNYKKRFLGLCACVATPIMLVACGLMWYNYIRYGSVFEFGHNYLICHIYVKAGYLINPVGMLTKILIGFFCYIVPSFDIKASFPFVYLKTIETSSTFKTGIFNTSAMGLIALPVTWFISGIAMVKRIINNKQKPIFYLVVAMITLGFLQILIVMLAGGVIIRYCVDFFWLFVLSGLFCAYFIYRGIAKYQEKIIQIQQQKSLNLCEMTNIVITTTMIISILLIFLVTLNGNGEGSSIWNNNPAVYYSIQRLLGFNTW